jgi:hypothetical protein
MHADFRSNRIISFLPKEIIEEWTPHFEEVNLKSGQVLYEPGSAMGHLYFPITAIVYGVHTLGNGVSTKIATTGREGVVGIYLLMGAAKTHNQAIVHKAGTAIRLRLSVLLHHFNHGSAVQKIFLRYAQTLFIQMSQSSVCHKHHSLEQQLSRMFLQTLDQQDDLAITGTHESMADVLGVRREAVSQAARHLMNENVITYSRGHITVLDRAALEKRTCECYKVITDEYRNFIATV